MKILAVNLLGYLAMLLGAFIIFRVFVRRAYLTHGRITAFPLLLEFLICGLYCNFSYLYLSIEWPNLPSLPEGLLLRIPGVGLVSLGIIVTLVGMGNLGFLRLFGLGSPAIHQRGVYGVCRNPQIVGFFIYTLGVAVLWPSWYAFGWVLLFVPVFHMMVMTEEEYLLQLHGEVYRGYCESVPRYIRLPRRLFGTAT